MVVWLHIHITHTLAIFEIPRKIEMKEKLSVKLCIFLFVPKKLFEIRCLFERIVKARKICEIQRIFRSECVAKWEFFF